MIIDLDSNNISSLVINVTVLFHGDNYILPDVPSGLQLFNNSHPEFALSLTYSGEQSIQVYEELLRLFKFSSTAEEPQPGNRQVLFQVFNMNAEAIFASNVAETIIMIEPVNDLPPEFTQTVYNGNVSENQPAGSFVDITVLAIDPDVHSDTNITYSIKGENDNFAIHSVSGVVTTRNILDAEKLLPIEELIIVATDSDGITSQSATAIVRITIIDINDHAPEFSKDFYQESVLEDVMKGTTLMVPGIAIDSDASAQNSDITYSIPDAFVGMYESGLGSGDFATIFPFEINSITGVISTTQLLDRESVPQYTFKVLAVDSGFPTLESTASVTITLTDVNDNPPRFLNASYTATYSMSELTQFGLLVLEVEANDEDEGLNAEIAYSLNGTDAFSINSTSGQIVTTGGLNDGSQQSAVIFTVIATDMGVQPMSSDATVSISILNENPPTFNETFIPLSFPENDQFEFVISAYDVDGDLLTYSIANVCLSDKFLIDQLSGKVVTLSPLDRETTPSCTLVVVASDGQLSSSASVLITVEDENDNCPVFEGQPYLANVSEASMIGTNVIQVTAVDSDMGTNSLVSYGISSGNINGAFDISQAGLITIASLGFKNVNKYTLTVLAQDSGSPPCTSTSTVMIVVTDSAPALLLSDRVVSYVEESDPVLIASDIVVVDPNSNLLQQASATFTHPPCPVSNGVVAECDSDLICMELCGERVEINSTLLGDVVVSMYAEGLQFSLNFSGEAPILHYQGIFSTLTYTNIAEEPVPGNRTVELVVFDGELYSNMLEITITMQLVDDNCPQVNANKADLSFFEESVSLRVGEAADLTITDVDAAPHQSLSQLLIAITGDVDGEYENITVSTAGLTSLSIQKSSSSISISGTASLDEYEEVLQSLTYYNTRPEPTHGQRVILITPVQEDLNCIPVQFSLSVILIDDNLPQIILELQNTTELVYEEESGSLLFAEIAGLRIVDDDDSTFFPVQLATVVLQGVQDIGHESISIGSGLPPKGLSVAMTDTSITITGNGTTSQYESLIRSISYQNSNTEPYHGNRSVTITVLIGQNTASIVFFLTVQTINDNQPQLYFNGTENVVYVEQSGVYHVGTVMRLRISDADRNDQYTAVIELLNPLDGGSEMIGLDGAQDLGVTGT